MSNDAFDSQLLGEKLSKLNNSQQSIESLSRWCILHREKARKIVETWEKLFNSRQKEQRVSFLYLANDILQNSKRLGNEFVSEFWKVLPAGLKQVYDNGDEQGKKAVTRLVNIWEERKVFGSRGSGLKDELLGKNPAPSVAVATNGKVPNMIKIVKRDAQFVRIKLTVGSLPEKILTAFQTVLDEQHNEEDALNACNTAVIHADKIMGELEHTNQGIQPVPALANELQEHEHAVQQCVDKLESAEATRHMLISQLKEAIRDQETKMAVIHSQLQVARGQIEHSCNLRKSLTSGAHSYTSGLNVPSSESSISQENNMPQIQSTSPPPHPQPPIAFAPAKPSDDESKKAAAAAVAAKLTASTSSAQMLSSVLSSLVAEEVASMNSSAFSSLSHFQPEKRQKLEKPMVPPEGSNSDSGEAAYFSALQPPAGATMPQVPPAAMQQPISQSFGPLPPQAPTNPSGNQYVQSAGMMGGVMQYGYGGSSLPPPPPLPPRMPMGLGRPGTQAQMSPPQPPPQQQQTAGASGYYRPPGIGFYGQNHQAGVPPVQRQ